MSSRSYKNHQENLTAAQPKDDPVRHYEKQQGNLTVQQQSYDFSLDYFANEQNNLTCLPDAYNSCHQYDNQQVNPFITQKHCELPFISHGNEQLNSLIAQKHYHSSLNLYEYQEDNPTANKVNYHFDYLQQMNSNKSASDTDGFNIPVQQQIQVTLKLDSTQFHVCLTATRKSSIFLIS